MSSNHLNMYVARNAKGLNSLETLCATMFGTKKGKFNQRQQLQYLREMCIYLSAVASIEDTVFMSIIGYLKDLGDSDADRKLYRTAVHLLIECITQYGARGELTSKRSSVYSLITQFEKELKHKTWSTRQMLVWRSLGTIAHMHQISPKSESSDVGSSVLTRLLTNFDELQYPVKQKKSVLFGEDKDFLPKLMSWAAVASGLVRTGEALPRRSWDNLQHGLNCAIYKPLAQHAHRLLFHTARQLTDAKQQLEFINLLLTDQPAAEKTKDKDTKDGGAKEAMRLTDPVCGMYYIRTLAALAHNCAELQALHAATAVSAPEVPQVASQAEIVRVIINLFVSALKYLDSDVKFVTELVAALFNKQDGVQLVVLCNQVLSSRAKGRDPKKNVVALATQALARLLGTPQIAEGVHLSPLLRASEVLGKFLVHRPYTTAREHQRDGDCIAGLWITLRRLYNNYMRPKEGGGAVGSDAQRCGRGMSLRQARAPAGPGQSGANCAGYVAPSYWTWPSDNASIATTAVSENPHTLCALLSAQIWMAPDKRYCPKEHALLWSSFVESLLTSWQLATTTLARDFDVLSLLLPLLTQVFARVQASVVRAAPASAGGAISDTAASFLGLGSVKEVGAGTEAAKELHAYYEPVYVDTLLALSEQLVATTRSGIAVTFLQSVWQWLASLTCAKAHPQQAALQLKYDMARKAAAPTFGGGGLLVPTVGGAPGVSEPASGADGTGAFDEHAGRALLQSLVRMALLAQQAQHLHVASVRPARGTPRPAECSMVMQNLHLSSLWHLADNITLCYGLALDTNHDSDDGGHIHGFGSHNEAVLMAVGLLSESAAQASLPNLRNASILALVKVTAKLVLQHTESGVSGGSDDSLALLRALARELASVFLANFSNTLDLTYRQILHQAVAATAADATVPARAALGAKQECEQLLVDILSHLFAQNGTDAPIQPATSVYAVLHQSLQAMCAVLQDPSKPVSSAVREYLQSQADNKHNAFVLILPPPLPFGADEVEKEPELPLEHDELSAMVKPKSGTLFSFDDDLLSGWSASSASLPPPKAPATGSSSGNLLVDLWLMDAPLEPTVAATTHTFDVFGSGAVPLVAAKAGGFDTSTHLAPPPAGGMRKASFYRDIYDEDDSLDASPPPSTSAAPSFSAQNSSFGGSFRSSPAGSSKPTSEPSFSTRLSGIAATPSTDVASGVDGFDWPGSSAAPPLPSGDDGFTVSSAAVGWDAPPAASSGAPFTATADWPGTSEAFTASPATNDGFLPTSRDNAWATGPTATAPTDSLATGFAPSSAGVGGVTNADDGFGLPPPVNFPIGGLAPSAPPTAAAAAAGSTAALSKDELAANAAAKRANRRVTIDPSLGMGGKPTGGETPPPVPAKTVYFSPEIVKESGTMDMAGFAPSASAAVGVAAPTQAVAVKTIPFGDGLTENGTTDFMGFAPSVPTTAQTSGPHIAPVTAASTVSQFAPLSGPATTSIPASAPAPASAGATTDMSGWGEIPDDFGFGSKPSEPKRASVGPAPVPGSLETLSKSDMAAIAAAKRANRRQSTGSILPGVLPVTKATTPSGASTDPFFGAPAPTLAPTKPAAAAQNGRGGSFDGFLAAAAPAVDPFAPTAISTTNATPVVGDWPGVSSDGFATAPTVASTVSAPVATSAGADDFHATPADFAPTPATAPYYDPSQGAYGGAPGYGYPPAGYPAAQGYPAYDTQYGYGDQQYPGGYGAQDAYGTYPPAYDANGYAYPPAPAAGGAAGTTAPAPGGYYDYSQPYQPYLSAPGQNGAPQQQYGYPGYAYPPQPPAAPNGQQPASNATSQYSQNGQW